MSVLMISFLMSLGSTAWIYNKMSRRSGGGNIKPAVIGSAVTGLVIFIILFLTLSMLFNK